MSNIRVTLHTGAIKELILRSPEVAGIVKDVADGIRNRCGDGYESDSYLVGNRYVSSVYTNTEEAAQDNLENNTLLKATK